MGFFRFLSRKPASESSEIPVLSSQDLPLSSGINNQPHENNDGGIESIYHFLQDDYETRGFNDALTNPDDSYKRDNESLIRLDLQILIQKVNTYYEDLESQLDMHIESRERAGLIDLVDELRTRKKMVAEHKNKVTEIQAGMNNENSMTKRIILSYQRGFMRGLASLSQSRVLNKKF